jgi:DNA-binding CsgD family transcriptional regulator
MTYYDPGLDLPEQPTPAQIRVMQAIADGHISNSAIAEHLGLALGTVQSHLGMCYQRIGAKSKCHALVRMWELGYVTIDQREDT